MNERQQKIYDLVQSKGNVSVADLAKIFYVSEMTVRRDLMELEKNGMLNRYHGGAVSKSDDIELPISQRVYVAEEEKRELGKKAEKYLHDKMTVFLDSSSTCSYIIPYLKKYKEITLITNSLKSLMTAAEYHIPSILIGGEYYEPDMCFIGTLAESISDKINVDIAFFSTLSLSDDGIISDLDSAQVQVRKTIIKNAEKIVFLFESSKLHKKSLYTVCKVEDITEILLSSAGD